ncbi:MFS transporter [Gordonia insulae]|uniref:Enterobactin exporter EntS n=1 Tax=Gordonia insulae TaxID=2420509 RepID=A0A3G8JR81_9ACTN|nr:MFS transporter [Gordonia insulae]AZG47641.1 Enterobactin exporter EntS [Gordonia insulae]
MTARVEAHPVAPARGPLRLLVDRQFGSLFWAKIFSVVGVWTHSLVAALVVFDATGSALMVGLVGVVQFGPQLLLSPLSGTWADRGDPARQIMIGRVLCILGSGTVALLLFCLRPTGGPQVTAVVLIGSLVVGVGFVVGGPAMQSIVPSLIRPGELPTAMALNSVPMTVGRIVGPVIGAFIAAHLGPAWAFAVSAALNSVFVAVLAMVRFPRPEPKASGQDFRVRAALRYVWHDRPLLFALIGVAAVGFASDPAITLAPSMAAEVGGGAQLVGQLSAAFGVGAALALAVLAALRGRLGASTTAFIGLLLLATGSAAVAVAPGLIVTVIGFGAAGLGFGSAMTGLSTVVQERAPDELRGRVMALWMVGFVGSRPLAAAVLGGSADAFSAQVAFGISGLVVFATAALCRLGPTSP